MIPSSNAECNNVTAGLLRYNAGTFEGCNGSEWLPLSFQVPQASAKVAKIRIKAVAEMRIAEIKMFSSFGSQIALECDTVQSYWRYSPYYACERSLDGDINTLFASWYNGETVEYALTVPTAIENIAKLAFLRRQTLTHEDMMGSVWELLDESGKVVYSNTITSLPASLTDYMVWDINQ